MNSAERRNQIYATIEATDKPISATSLAQQFGVSRQSIVGDIAILRASGNNIIATARGYLLESSLYQSRFIQRLACCHSIENTSQELEIIVDLGGEILDVIVDHELYGEFTGRLNISNHADIENFIERRKTLDAKLLSELTEGIHLHTIATANADIFANIRSELLKNGFLVDEI